jgi:hypothetical protein
MIPETPAAHLARLKEQFPGWTIRGVARGTQPMRTTGTSHSRDRHTLDAIYAPTLAALEAKLAGGAPTREAL